MSRIRAIILDFDGVLAESNSEKTAAFEALAALYPACGGAMMAYHRSHYSSPRMKKFEYFVEVLMGYPGDRGRVERLAEQFSEFVVRRVVACPAVPGAVEFLREFSSRVPLYVSSVTPQEELRKILRARGLDSYLVEAFGDPPCAKAEAIQAVLQREGLRPEEAAFVGDSISDYRAAAAAGLMFLGRDSGLPFEGVDVALFPDLFGIASELRNRI